MLAISMIPTVLGAWLGLVSGFYQTMLTSPIITFVAFLVGFMFFSFMIERNKNSSTGVVWLMVFTFFMGVMLARMLGIVLGLRNGAEVIASAFGGTAFIFFGMAFVGTVVKKEMTNLGKFLMIGSWVLLAAVILGLFFHSSAFHLAIIVGILLLSSLWIMYDVNRIVQGGETNYIMATLSLYVNIYNVFQTLLALFGFASRDE
jgi:FtsH-binding integral membrane protein